MSARKLESGLHSQAKPGGVYFLAIEGSTKDPGGGRRICGYGFLSMDLLLDKYLWSAKGKSDF